MRQRQDKEGGGTFHHDLATQGQQWSWKILLYSGVSRDLWETS